MKPWRLFSLSDSVLGIVVLLVGCSLGSVVAVHLIVWIARAILSLCSWLYTGGRVFGWW